MFCFKDGTKLNYLEDSPVGGISFYRCPSCRRVYRYQEAAGQYNASMEEMTAEDMEEWELTELGKKLKGAKEKGGEL